MKKTEELGYNPSLGNLIDDAIPSDRKTYNTLSGFINEHLWKQLDDEILEKIGRILDDPKHEYDKDLTMTRMLLKSFLPTFKKKLGITKDYPLHKRISSLEPTLQPNGESAIEAPVSITTDPSILDRLIVQQLKFYHSNESAPLLYTLLQGRNDTPALDYQLMEAKQTRKSIVANILVFMLLEEENQGNTKKKIIHKFA